MTHFYLPDIQYKKIKPVRRRVVAVVVVVISVPPHFEIP
jgi:hypothetical protein